MKTAKMLTILVLALGLMVCPAKVTKAAPMGTAFTYQGWLIDRKKPANDIYDFQCALYDDPDPNVGMQVSSTLEANDVNVVEGHFTLALDFGSGVFDGNAIWLKTAVRPGDSNDVNDFVTLIPRQEITPVPYALQTRGIFVDNASNIGIGTASPSERLDVGGNINTSSTYKIGGDTVLSAPGSINTFVGVGAGEINTGAGNTFLGYSAGSSNTTASSNTCLGYSAGSSNTTGYDNTFLGSAAGRSNMIGCYNTFLGRAAGYNNTTANHNTFLGHCAGYNNTTGSDNTILGRSAGGSNTAGNRNTFVGRAAGYNNTTGTGNVFIGYRAGYYEIGSEKLYIANGPNDASVLIYGDFSTGNIGIGTTSPAEKLHVNGNLKVRNIELGQGDITDRDSVRIIIDRDNDQTDQTFSVWRDGTVSPPGTELFRIQENGNVGVGTTSPGEKLTVGGTIESTSGGFKFPDGTTMTSSASPTVNSFYDAGSSSTNSTSWQTKMSHSINIAPGKIVLTLVDCDLHVPGTQANTMPGGEVRLVIAGNEAAIGQRDGTFDTSTLPRHGWTGVSLHSVQTNLSGSVNFQIQWRSIFRDITIRRVRMTVLQL